MPEATSMPVAATRVKVAESSRQPMRPTTAEPSGTLMVDDALTVIAPVLLQPAVTYVGASHVEPALLKTMMTASPSRFVVVEKSSVGSDSVSLVATLYQAPTFIEPVPLPVLTAPSANSVISVQPETCAVIAKSFHDASSTIMSPVTCAAGT